MKTTVLEYAFKKLISFEICEIFKDTYFEEHLRATASGRTAALKNNHDLVISFFKTKEP